MARLPLEGLKVADFTWVAAGPITTKYLADHGATVVKVESHARIDVLRLAPPFPDGVAGLNRSGFFANYNSSKYSISLNLNRPEAVEVARRLVLWADVVAENFTPGTMKRWSLDYESLVGVRPDIIYLSSSMQGRTGPHSRHPGYGNNAVSLAGFTHMTGRPDRDGVMPYGAYTDFISPRFGVAAVMAHGTRPADRSVPDGSGPAVPGAGPHGCSGQRCGVPEAGEHGPTGLSPWGISVCWGRQVVRYRCFQRPAVEVSPGGYGRPTLGREARVRHIYESQDPRGCPGRPDLEVDPGQVS
ncbi:MAG: CoA transferase [Chloroflexi bacterium]|nr:CoA transferase [Chloroflexota bacterium]